MKKQEKKSSHSVWTKDSAAAFISYPFPFNSISPFNNCWRLQIKLLMLLSSSSSNLQTKIHIFYWTFQSSYVFSGAKTPNKPKMVLLLSGINAVPTNLTCTVCTRIDVLVHTVSPSIRCHSWLNRHYVKIQINRHFFAQKSTFWGYFEQKLDKFLSHFNKPLPQNSDFFIRRWRLIYVDTVEKRIRRVIPVYISYALIKWCFRYLFWSWFNLK